MKQLCILTLLLVLLSKNVLTGQAIDDQFYVDQAYQIVNTVCDKGQAKHKLKLIGYPIKLTRLDDSLLYNLVDKGKINHLEVDYILSQVNKKTIVKWEASKIKNAKIIRKINKRRYPVNTYGFSPPLFSKDNNIAIIYIRYFGYDMLHEEISVYEKRGTQWEYLTSLFSLIS